MNQATNKRQRIPKEHKLPCIYKATSKTTGKSYIGQTVIGLHKRKLAHIRALKYVYSYKLLSEFHQALLQYGIEDFEWSVLFFIDKLSLTRSEILKILNEKEVWFISKFNSYKEGYNSNRGGGNVTPIGYIGSFEEIRQAKLLHRREYRKQHPEKRVKRLTLEKKEKAKERRNRPHRKQRMKEYKARVQSISSLRKKEYRKQHPEYREKARLRSRLRRKQRQLENKPL